MMDIQLLLLLDECDPPGTFWKRLETPNWLIPSRLRCQFDFIVTVAATAAVVAVVVVVVVWQLKRKPKDGETA